jgi:hypothetical protein
MHIGVCLLLAGYSLSKKATSKAKSKRTNTKNSFCPENAWFVSDLLLGHSPGCDSIGPCSTKDMMELPGFQSAIVPGLSSAFKRVAESVKIVHNINVDHRSAMLYKAIARAKKKIAAVTDDTYGKLPAFLTFSVDLDTGTCDRCADRLHLQMPCRHIIAAVFSQSGSRTSTSGAYRYFHHAFTVVAYAHAFQDTRIHLPFVPALLLDENIKPPPLYNQAGGSSQRLSKGATTSKVARDRASREKRIPSRGEGKILIHLNKGRVEPDAPSAQAEVAAKMREFFRDEIRAREKKKRQKYTCSRCGKAEHHNAAKCPNRSKGDVDTDVQPGNYLVGTCPLKILEMRNGFVPSEADTPATSAYNHIGDNTDGGWIIYI